MGRPRKISKDDILDAAERVIEHLGSTGLSIDAVAQKAGISKSRVVYDHKSKSGLLEALVARQMAREMADVAEAVVRHRHTLHPELFARIELASRSLTDTDRAIVMAVSASMSSAEHLQDRIREWKCIDMDAMQAGPRPEAAVMAYLALTGMFCLDLFGHPQWTASEKATILDGVRSIYENLPLNTPPIFPKT
ncbi:TetR/AcrR family transcriptional regulator [Rhizobium sp.]|uniref:TetR/AcrR family transcriptional regulator n=1 Tax=Rhizobium sp. TaxID=391 RepID=UPI0028B0EDD7